MGIIYHITTRKEWDKAKSKGFYEAPSLQTEGFIHCSGEGQVAGVIQRYFQGKESLVKLHLDTRMLIHPVKLELAPSVHETFPHLYGPLNLEAVVKIEDV